MNGPAIFLALFVMLLIAVLSIPLSYYTSIYVGSPFRLAWRIRWLGRAFYYEWDYQAGRPPKKICYIRWKDYYREKRYEEWLSKNVNKEIADQNGDPWEDLSQEDSPTYEELRDSTDQETLRQRWQEEFWWWPFIANAAFGKAFAAFALKVLFHSRIRRFYLSGAIGLPQSYETGLLSALLYAAIPAHISRLRFNYTAEEYDLRGYANGRMYPAVLLLHLTGFTLSRPMRTLLHQWFKRRKEEDHG